MRSWILRLAFAAIVAAALAAAPTPANAQLPPVIQSGYRFGPYGYYNAVGTPVYRWQLTPWGFNQALFFPGAYSTTFGPFGAQQSWTGQALITRSYSPWLGWSSRVTTPVQYGYSFNPYSGFQPYIVPGATVMAGFDPVWGAQAWAVPNFNSRVTLSNSTFSALGASTMDLNLLAALTAGNGFSGPVISPLAGVSLLPTSGLSSPALTAAVLYNGYVPANFILR